MTAIASVFGVKEDALESGPHILQAGDRNTRIRTIFDNARFFFSHGTVAHVGIES